jgi:hypothetical protein
MPAPAERGAGIAVLGRKRLAARRDLVEKRRQQGLFGAAAE